jgi:integrase
MLYATTGLRRDEILSLKPEDIDFDKRMFTPGNHRSARVFLVTFCLSKYRLSVRSKSINHTRILAEEEKCQE